MFHKKKNKKKMLLLFLCVFLFFFLAFFIKERSYTQIEKIVHDIGSNIYSFLIPEKDPTNNSLIEGINLELEKENQELKKLLEVTKDLYKVTFANVIKRNTVWNQTLTINKGTQDGIKEDMAVVSSQGLIGRIEKVGNTSSTVRLLTSNTKDMKVAVDIIREEEYIHGILDSFLEEEQVFQVNHIPKIYDIQVGDKVYTNGLGGIYPTSIYIGKVIETTTDQLDLNKIVKVKPDASFDRIYYVTVISKEPTS